MSILFSNLEENTHARCAPSSASRWTKCAGSVQLSQEMPDTSGSAAAEGTLAHELAEKMLKNNLRTWKEIQQGFPNDQYTEEMFEHVLEYCKYAESLNVVSPKVEFRSPLFYSPGESGTIDFTGVDKYNVLHVLDLKYGRGVFVGVKNNLQLIIYAISALDQIQGHTGIKAVRTHIFQPRLRNIEYEEYTLEQLEESRIKITEAEKQTWSATPKLVPTKSNCIWCKARSVCPAVAKKALDSIGADFENLDTVEEVCSKEPATLSPDKLARILQAKELLVAWLNSIENHVIEQISSGKVHFSGLALRRKRGRVVWQDEEAAIVLLKKTGNSDLIKTVLPTPLQIASAFKKAKKQAPSELNEHILEKEGKLSVITEKSA